MNRNTLIALVVALGVTVMLLLYRIRTEEPEVVVAVEEEEEDDDAIEQDILEPELEVLPEGYQSDGGVPGLVRVFDGAKEIQLAGEEEYTCEAAGGGEEPLFAEVFEGLKVLNGNYRLSSQYTGDKYRIRRFYDNEEIDITGETNLQLFENLNTFLFRKEEEITTDFSDFGVLNQAYGIDRLVESYTGPLFQVINDSAELLDIGTVVDQYGNYRADTSAMLNHAGTGNAYITKLYDQKGSSDLTFDNDNAVIAVESGELVYNEHNTQWSPYVLSTTTTDNVSCVSMTDNASIVMVSSGGSVNNYIVRLTNSSGVERLQSRFAGNFFNHMDIETPSHAFSTFQLNRPTGSAGWNKMAIASFSTTDLDFYYSYGDPGFTDNETDAYGTFTVNQLQVTLYDYTFTAFPSKNYFNALLVYETISDDEGLKSRLTQLYGVRTGGSVVSAYDQSGNSNAMEYVVANEQPVVNDFGLVYTLENQRDTVAFRQPQRIGYTDTIKVDTPTNEFTVAVAFNSPGIYAVSTIVFDYFRLVTDAGNIVFRHFDVSNDLTIRWDGATQYTFAGASETGGGLLMVVCNETDSKIFWDGELVASAARSIGTVSKITGFFWSGLNTFIPWQMVGIWPEDKSSLAQEIYQNLDETYNFEVMNA